MKQWLLVIAVSVSCRAQSPAFEVGSVSSEPGGLRITNMRLSPIIRFASVVGQVGNPRRVGNPLGDTAIKARKAGYQPACRISSCPTHGIELASAYYWQAPQPAFEVATVKIGAPIKGETYIINTGRILHGVVTLGNVTLSDCIKFAYLLTTDAQLAGPDWIMSKQFRFDVTAKALPDTPADQLLLMLQTLLKDRFQMTVHIEHREMTHYELVIGKNGPKLHESTVDQDAARGAARLDGITSNRMDMNKLAMLMSRMTRMPVLDRTGLKEFYEIKVQWAPEDISGKIDENPVGPSIFTAVKEQLGLKLESKKGPVEVLVVDHAEKVPVEN